VLSARNEERLQEQVRQLLAWVQAESQMGAVGTGLAPVRIPEQKLQDLAYTLQVGREAMEERLALQVSSLAELEEKLGRYLCDLVQEGGDWYRGQVKQYKEMVTLLSVDEELQEVIGKWFQRGKYEKLLQWWVKGGTIDWKLLYTVGAGSAVACGLAPQVCTIPTAPAMPRRISLPTYPFARERYWVPTPKSG